MERYADHPMDLADASLVVAAEALGTRRVFTIDRRDFGTYRVRRAAGSYSKSCGWLRICHVPGANQGLHQYGFVNAAPSGRICRRPLVRDARQRLCVASRGEQIRVLLSYDPCFTILRNSDPFVHGGQPPGEYGNYLSGFYQINASFGRRSAQGVVRGRERKFATNGQLQIRRIVVCKLEGASQLRQP